MENGKWKMENDKWKMVLGMLASTLRFLRTIVANSFNRTTQQRFFTGGDFFFR